jgi:hypothetical protein
MEQRLVGKASEIVIGQAVPRGRIEQHALVSNMLRDRGTLL